MRPETEKVVLATGIALSVVVVCIGMFRFFVWPLYRDGHRRSLAARAVVAASDMRSVVAGRLLKHDGRPINEGLRIAVAPPVTGGYVAADGSVVINAQLDAAEPLTVVLHPQVERNAVQWTCGVPVEAQLRYVSSSCHQVVRMP